MDIYFVAKDSKELKKGAKSEFAAKIREVATQLHDGLVELNSIREELQSTSPEDEGGRDTAHHVHKEKGDDQGDSEEDEIDRIKKAIKKDIENRVYEWKQPGNENRWEGSGRVMTLASLAIVSR